VACPPGYYSREGGSVCFECLPGQFSFAAASFCEDCPTGKTSLPGASSCFADTMHSSWNNFETRVISIAGSIITKVGSAVCVGSSMFANLGMITKIVQNIRFMKIHVSDELSTAFDSWNIDFFSWSIPEKLSSLSESEKLPEVFAQYEMDSRFLVNYWASLAQSLIGIILFFGFKILGYFMKGRMMNEKGFASKMLDFRVLAASNFAIIQIYGCLDDIVFYGLIDLRFGKFAPSFSAFSSVIAIVLLIIGALIFMLHIWILWKSTELRKLPNHKEALGDFLHKFEPLQILYQDFKDTTTIRQSFFALLITRSILSSLIMSTLFEKPLLQAILLMILSVSALSLLISKGPYKEFSRELTQYFYELIVFMVSLGVLIMAVADEMNKEAFSLRKILGKSIVFLNAILFIGSMGLMCIEIYGKICEIYEMWLKSKALSKVQNEEKNENRERSSVYNLSDNSHLQSFGGGGEEEENNNISVLLKQGQKIVRRKNQIIPFPIKESFYLEQNNHQRNFTDIMTEENQEPEIQTRDKKIADVFKKKLKQGMLPENYEFEIPNQNSSRRNQRTGKQEKNLSLYEE